MAHKWIATKFKGIRYREHPTRKHGRQPDRYFNVRFQVAGVSVNEGYGWASEGMSASKAALLVAELKEDLRTGNGTGKLADRRKAREDAEQDATAKKQEQKRRAITYAQYFNERYLPSIQSKKPSTKAREISLHELWILPAMGRTPIKDICLLDIRRVKQNMEKKGLAPRSVQYAFACIRMVISHAVFAEYYLGVNPIKKIEKNDKPKVKNKRIRFFSHEEADKILQSLKKRSQDVHDMALLSMHCGSRAGEGFALTWGDVDLVHGLVTLLDTKGNDRTVSMTRAVSDMFKNRIARGKNELVFPSKSGKPHGRISKTFERVIDTLGMNKGVTDRRKKVVFHTCRHTCASWYVMNGTPLYTVQKIMGHSTIAMTERYAHLAPMEFKAAAELLDKSISTSRAIREKTNVVAIG